MANRIADLEKAPGSRTIHGWADYIEMLALQNPDKEVSKADVLDRILERQDLGEAKDIAQEIGSGDIKEDDKKALFIVDCYRMLEYRVGAFGDAYPFRVSEDHKVLQCEENPNSLHAMYIFLLLAANLNYVDKQFWSEITTTFEFVSLEALKSYLPSNAKVINFGTHSKDERYVGKLSEKIHHLAEDLNLRVHPEVNNLDPKNTGDAGLDLVGYIPFEDKADGILHVFCQCACGDDWGSKQHECSEQAWQGKLVFTARLPHMVFIPYCFRSATGSWYGPLTVMRSILVDRVRLMGLIGKNQDVLTKFTELPAVKEFLAEEESIF